MTARFDDYVAGGYFLSRCTGEQDGTGNRLRRVTLASDHSSRNYFPDAWTLSWTGTTAEERLRRGATFGIPPEALDRIGAWADEAFGSRFGAWSVFYKLEDARTAAKLLSVPGGLDLWGVGLRRELRGAFCDASAPAPSPPGFAPGGAAGVHEAACRRPEALAPDGRPLGHELLVLESGNVFNSPESRHLDEPDLLKSAGIVPNAHGLIDSYEEARIASRLLDSRRPRDPGAVDGWLPWLIVEYPL